MTKYRRMVHHDFGSPDGALIFEETGFVKKGQDSVGVYRQYGYEFTRRRVRLSHEGLPQKERWLVIRRTLGSNPEYDYFISNAPVSTRLPTFTISLGKFFLWRRIDF